jgi:hypothetical protein
VSARERLAEQADREHAPAWIPEAPGDEIVGVVAAIRPAVPTQFGPVPVVELAELDTRAPAAVWLIHTVLRREFERARVIVGETILVRYLGRVAPEGGGAAYESYKLVVDRPDENNAVDWGAIAERYGDDEPNAQPSNVPVPTPAPSPPPAEDDIPF